MSEKTDHFDQPEAAERPLKEIYMHVSSGQKYYPFDPKAEDVDIFVIAHHLATRARWNGATQHPQYPNKIFYSVAEHSVYCALYVEEFLRRPDLALVTLLHDAAEAYNGDLIRPLKYSVEFREPFKKVEAINEQAVADKFNLPYPMPKEVKIADEAVCSAEFEQIIPKCDSQNWDEGRLHDDTHVAPFEIAMLDPASARDLFLHHYMRLTQTRVAAA